jgi:hypothetical protein
VAKRASTSWSGSLSPRFEAFRQLTGLIRRDVGLVIGVVSVPLIGGLVVGSTFGLSCDPADFSAPLEKYADSPLFSRSVLNTDRECSNFTPSRHDTIRARFSCPRTLRAHNVAGCCGREKRSERGDSAGMHFDTRIRHCSTSTARTLRCSRNSFVRRTSARR